MRTVNTPFVGAVDVIPNDTTIIKQTRAVYIGVTGDVKVTMADGTTATFKAVPIGEYLWSVKKVHATDTTATNIVALY